MIPSSGPPHVGGEREFLFRSLDDLDAEHEAGNIDDATYLRLRSDYTARAAAALRSELAADATSSAASATVAAPISARRRLLTVVGVVAFGVATAIVLTTALGGRLPGQTGSGNSAAVSQAERQETLERAIRETPGDPHAHLALARFLMAREQFPAAFAEFSAAAALDPAIAEAQAYSGWLLYLAGRVDEAIVRLDAAIAADETYPDAHFFTGVARFRGKADAAGAIPQFQRYLTLAPDNPLADQVRGLLAEAVAASGSADPDQAGQP